VLCPRGVPRHDAPRSADRWTFAGLAPFEKELHAALAALQEAYPRHVDPEHPVFAGFSLGAILGVHLLKKADSPFERAVLIEGGYKGWGVAGARAFARRGGKKLLLGCGQTACVHAGKQVKRLFGEGPTGVEVVSGGNVGHTYDGEVARAVREHWGWLVQGDARFSPPRSNESP
jgi:predicted esterase